MNIDRLNHLANILEKVPESQFEMDHWHNSTVQNECGFAACAVGHACCDPVFNEQGLELTGPVGAGFRGPCVGTLIGWSAVKQFFDLNTVQARHLFSLDSYRSHPTPNQVASRIRALIAGGVV